MLSQIAAVQSALWALSQATLAILLVRLLLSRNYVRYPFFFVYLFLNLVQGGILFIAYSLLGFEGTRSFGIAWFTQGLVLGARGLAVAELYRRILSTYRGIWALATRLLATSALIITMYSLYAADWRWKRAVVLADRAVELAIASFIVALFVFARYYRVPVSQPDRYLALGFCIYSCSVVLSTSLLERFYSSYRPAWNLPLQLTFLVTLMVWLKALWSPLPATTKQAGLVKASVYQELSPAINLRLRMLNEQLLAFWRTKVPHL